MCGEPNKTGIRNCQRSLITKLMRNANIPIPPQEGNKGYWLKRGDEAAQSENDIIYCANKKTTVNRQKQLLANEA